MNFKVPSNPNHSIILGFYDTTFSSEVILAAKSVWNLKPAVGSILSWKLQKKHADFFM